MRIMFVNPATAKYTRSVTSPLGLLSIASYLKSLGHSVCIYDRTLSKVGLDAFVDDFSPDICGISLLSYKSVKDSVFVSEKIRKRGIPVIWGGPFASSLADVILKADVCDAVSVGEGEETWKEICEYYSGLRNSLSEIKGLALCIDSQTVYTPQRDFIDLSVLPAIDWELVDIEKYFQSSFGCKKMLYLYAAKGCPFSCKFCYNKDFHRCTYRKRPLAVLLEEIRYLVEKHGLDGVYFADELWCTSREEMHGICDKLKGLGLDFVWGCQTRIGLFDADDFRYMYDSGCRWVFFGVESGSEKMLSQINKKLDYEKIVPTFSDCTKAGLVAIGSFISGFPGEDTEDLKKTVELINKLDSKMINLNYLALVPGSEIHKQLVARGLYNEPESIQELYKISPLERMEYNYSNIPDRDIKVVRACFMWRSFTSQTTGGEKFGFAKKVITDAVKSVFTGELLSFIASVFNAGTELMTIIIYSHLFIGTKKKYGIRLYKKI